MSKAETKNQLPHGEARELDPCKWESNIQSKAVVYPQPLKKEHALHLQSENSPRLGNGSVDKGTRFKSPGLI